MKRRLFEHFLSLAAVAALMAAGAGLLRPGPSKPAPAREFPAVDLADPFARALLAEALDLYYPGQADKNRAAVEEAVEAREKALLRSLQSSNVIEKLNWASAGRVLAMYLKFLLVYAAVLGLTYYGVQTLGVWWFVLDRRSLSLGGGGPRLGRLFKKAGGIGVLAILFSPAYVIAYSFRTDFNTDSLFFMAFLGVVSNGALASYANKFHHFLIAESRKGYVETALAKNLRDDFSGDPARGISWKVIVKPAKRFEGHVLGPIFENARHLYLSTLKEQGAFLITSLVIIEMALNLHGYFSYEMLRQLLYENYGLVLFFFFLIFLTVKLTDIVTDALTFRETRKFENR